MCSKLRPHILWWLLSTARAKLAINSRSKYLSTLVRPESCSSPSSSPHLVKPIWVGWNSLRWPAGHLEYSSLNNMASLLTQAMSSGGVEELCREVSALFQKGMKWTRSASRLLTSGSDAGAASRPGVYRYQIVQCRSAMWLGNVHSTFIGSLRSNGLDS